jgi:hypothetical protein
MKNFLVCIFVAMKGGLGIVLHIGRAQLLEECSGTDD